MENKSVTTTDKQSARKFLGDIANLPVHSEVKNPKSTSGTSQSTQKILAGLTADADRNNELLSAKLQFVSQLTIAASERRVSSLITGGEENATAEELAGGESAQKKKILQTRDEIFDLLDQGANMDTVIENLETDFDEMPEEIKRSIDSIDEEALNEIDLWRSGKLKVPTLKNWNLSESEIINQREKFIKWVKQDAQILSEDYAESRKTPDEKLYTQLKNFSRLTLAVKQGRVSSLIENEHRGQPKQSLVAIQEEQTKQTAQKIFDLLDQGANMNKAVSKLVKTTNETIKSYPEQSQATRDFFGWAIGEAQKIQKIWNETPKSQENKSSASSNREQTRTEGVTTLQTGTSSNPSVSDKNDSFFQPKNKQNLSGKESRLNSIPEVEEPKKVINSQTEATTNTSTSAAL